MEEAGAALAGALGGLRTIFAGVVPPAASGTQLGERDPAEEHPAPPPASAGVERGSEFILNLTRVERNVETTAAEPEAVAAAEAVVEGEAEELLEEAEDEWLEAMSLDELRHICRHFKLDDKGDKQQLIERAQEKRRFEASLPPKVAYHPNVRCRRGAGCTCGVGPVIVGTMYRVGEVCVCEGTASEEEKASGPVEPPTDAIGGLSAGRDLRGWGAADIQGLRGADGTLDLERAILCGVDLSGAELLGANLGCAQLQGVHLFKAKLQGADLYCVQLQGANLSGAQLQGVNLFTAELQGASLLEAQLQGADLDRAQLRGADLREAQLQGACLSRADLSVLPKGFLLPKRGSAGETEALEEDRPTNLHGANLSVLPKGSMYYEYNGNYGVGVRVCDAPRTTNLTGAKATGAIFTKADLSDANLTEANASGAIFTGANLGGANLTEANASGAIFTGADLSYAITTGATLKDAALKRVTFGTHHPPERPASAALNGAWRARALLGSVARGAMAAADDDDDSSDDDESEEEEEEEEKESHVEAEVEKALDTFMNNLATEAKKFTDTVDELVGLVKVRMDSILADGILANLLVEKLKEGNVKQAAINGILSTQVISPLLELLEKALLELLQPTDEALAGADANANADAKNADANADTDADATVAAAAEAAATAAAVAAGRQLQKQLLKAFKERALSAGKAGFLKRLSPIVNKCVRASSARVAQERTKSRCWFTMGDGEQEPDEEQALVQPKNSAHCLVMELWPALRASLEAQVSDVIFSSALAPIEKAGKSVRRIAERLNRLEGVLSSKYNAESKKLLKRFGLVGDEIVSGDKGGLHSRLLKTTLKATTQYEVSVGGFSGSFDMVWLAWTCSRAKLTKHENELVYLKKELEKLKEMTTTEQTWRDVTETWQATLALLKSIEVERGSAVLQCIASDENLLKAIGMAKALYDIDGDVPEAVVRRLNDGAGAHIRTHAYKYDKLISQELVRIQRVKDIQWRAVTLSGSAVVATMIGTANLLSRLYYDVLESGDSRLAVLLPVGAVAVVGLLLLCCFAGYHHRWLVQLCAPQRMCGKCWPQNTSAADERI